MTRMHKTGDDNDDALDEDSGGLSGVGTIVRLTSKAFVQHWGLGLIILGCLLIEMVFTAAVPMAYKYLVDLAILPRDGRALVIILSAMSIGLLVTSAAGLCLDFTHARFCTRLLNQLRADVFKHLQYLSADFFDRYRAADVMSRFSSDLTSFEKSLESAIEQAVLPAFNIVFSAVLMFLLDWRLGLIGLLAVPASLIGPKRLANKASAAGSARKRAESLTSSEVQENVVGFAVVKAFGLEKPMLERFTDRLARQAEAGMRVNFLSTLIERTAYIGTLIVQVLVMAVGAMMAFHNQLSLGSFAAFLALFGTFIESLSVTMAYFPGLVQAGAGMNRVNDFFAEKPSVQDAADAPALPGLGRRIRFEHVCFGYEKNRLAVSDVSLEIAAGQSVAFVGSSGSGKSTVLSLLARFRDPSSGRILWDDCDTRLHTQRSLREQLSLVFQESILFNTSIRENIRIGRMDATEMEIETASRSAELHDIVAAMPQGYETVVGERGSRLSGGQRQRVAIARALLRDPHLLVLDEAAAALDPATEATISRVMEKAGVGRTMISVTHRLSSIVKADRIFVMENGQLVEHGTHEQLQAAGGAYARLWAKQQGFTISEDGRAKVEAARLRTIPILRSLDDGVMEELAPLFVTEHQPADREVFRQGDSGDRFYLIARGRVAAWVQTPRGNSKKVRVMDDGDHFGEIALMENTPRTATIRTLQDCIFLTLSRAAFHELIARYPGLREHLQLVVSERLETSAKAVSVEMQGI